MIHLKVVLTVLLIGVSFPAAAESFKGVVRRVSDGDTFVCAGGRIVRLWGIDAPETGGPDGERARAALASLVEGKSVVCDVRSFDAHRRTVALCRMDGADVAGQMVSAGHACDWPKYSKGFYRSEQKVAMAGGFKGCVRFKHGQKGF